MSGPVYVVRHVVMNSEKAILEAFEHPEDIPVIGVLGSWQDVQDAAAFVVPRPRELHWRQLDDGSMIATYFKGAWAAWAAKPYLIGDAPGTALGAV